MSEVNTLQRYFQNYFAQEKIKTGISEEHITFLKILWYGFNDIVPKNKNQRKIYILEQIENYLTDTNYRDKINSLELPDLNEVIAPQNEATTRVKLKEINLVNFKGFQANDSGLGRKIDFNEKATLFFAPNGGGKTSLCEALEWALTGDSTERNKRKAESAGFYFQNNDKDSPSFNASKLTLTVEGLTIPDPIYDRCFLEKNRIEKFAKLAIQPSSDFQEVMGELFGFTDVVDFFKEFGQDISPTETEKNRPERENWRIWLDWNSRKTEQEKAVEDAKNEESDASDKLNNLAGNKKYDEKKYEIELVLEKQRKELEAIEINYGIIFSANEFIDKIRIFIKIIDDWELLYKNIADSAQKLDFENLYQSATIVFRSYKDSKCPLCDTPFKQTGRIFMRAGVVTDPREKAKRELVKLKQLTTWKNEINNIEIELRGAKFRLIRDEWQKIQLNLKEENWFGIAGQKEKPKIPTIDFTLLESKLEDDTKSFIETCKCSFSADFTHLTDLENIVVNYVKNRDDLLKAKPEKEKEIQNIKTEYAKLQEHINILTSKCQIRKTIEDKLKTIIVQAENSGKYKNILNVYSGIYASMQAYQASSILKEGADIDVYVTGFYRALNLYDHEGEKVKEIILPKSKQDKFCFKYSKDESKVCNALHLLSEGHLRTLGLSTLLARAVKYSMPILIFDDAINAIDSDHRDNIAYLLSGNISNENGTVAFGDKWDQVKAYLNDCQFIITSHDRFFDEKIANLFKKENQKRYVLYSGKTGIDFCERGNPANFEAKINNFLAPETQDIRSAIFYCRILLEEVCLKISALNKLKFKDSRVDEKLKQIKQPALEIILRVIKEELSKPACSEEQKNIAKIAEEILNEKGNYLWFFEVLNQESHNRRFDHVDVSNAPTSQEVVKIFKKIQEIYQLSTPAS
jgi:DNA sulfur modification protein DndD